MIPFLSASLFFILGFSSIIKTQQNELYFAKKNVKAGRPESDIKVIVKAHSGELKSQTLRTNEAGKEFDGLPTQGIRLSCFLFFSPQIHCFKKQIGTIINLDLKFNNERTIERYAKSVNLWRTFLKANTLLPAVEGGINLL